MVSSAGRKTVSNRKKHSLTGLFRRFVLGALMALIGSWLMAGVRLNLVRDLLSLNRHETVCFIIEFLSLTLALFGLLTLLSVFPELKDRIYRLEALGEREW